MLSNYGEGAHGSASFKCAPSHITAVADRIASSRVWTSEKCTEPTFGFGAYEMDMSEVASVRVEVEKEKENEKARRHLLNSTRFGKQQSPFMAFHTSTRIAAPHADAQCEPSVRTYKTMCCADECTEVPSPSPPPSPPPTPCTEMGNCPSPPPSRP